MSQDTNRFFELSEDDMDRLTTSILLVLAVLLSLWPLPGRAGEGMTPLGSSIYNPGRLKPIDSRLKVAEGMVAPDFTLPAISGKKVRLSSYRGRANVVLSFIPAAWTPVCSDQWPGYNIAREKFRRHDAVLLGISVDNVPTLHAWTEQMGGLWFEVLSDFWPHGAVAKKYGVLRGDGTAERTLVFIDRHGVITGVHVEDINVRPPLEYVFGQLENFSKETSGAPEK